MSYSKFATGTWLLAQVLHPFCFMFYSAARGGAIGNPVVLVVLGVISAVFSLPALALSIAALRGIDHLSVSAPYRMAFWLIALAFALLVSDAILYLAGSGWLSFSDVIQFTIPGYVAGVLASFIRARQFFDLFKLTTYEDDFLSKSE